MKHYWFSESWPHEVYEVSAERWAECFDRDPRRILAQTEVGDIRVSTVFLGLGEQWETMLFRLVPSGSTSGSGSRGDCEWQWRHRTYLEAAHYHANVVMHLMAGGRLEDIDENL